MGRAQCRLACRSGRNPPVAGARGATGRFALLPRGGRVPTGWAAGYAAVRTLVGEADHVLLDALAHPCLRDAATNATGNVHSMPHCAHDAVAERLASLRASLPRAGILVVTESLFRVDAAVPDLRAMRAACRTYGATLLVCVTHDLAPSATAASAFSAGRR